MRNPLDLDDARHAARRLAELRRTAEDEHEKAVERAADSERLYRKAFARAFVQATGTAAEREAKARSEAADAAYKRDLDAGMVKVAAERLRGLEGERSMLRSLMEWSQRRAA
jgi:hypothetical protein